MTADARSAILSRIRNANGSATTLDAALSAWQQIPRTYTQSSALSQQQTLELLIERLHDYNAQVVHCSRDQAPAAIEAILNQRRLTRFVIPPGLPPDILPAGIQVTVDDVLSPTALDGFDAAITLSTLAIAETGTLVLQNLPGQGRRATSLVPDVHLCIVNVRDVVATVPEAFARLNSTSTLPLTFVSGPSATADIEMTRIKGVHGPRFLHVLLLDDSAPEHRL
jgi:L-lactate dehydrogenase complex protein LldG